MEKIIVTDADGVLLNWEYAFCVWMADQGYTQILKGNEEYDLCKRFNTSFEDAKSKVRTFNASAAMGFLPALRDARYYVKRLHEELGYNFHCVTSLGLDPNAKKLRQMNLDKLFGPTAFSVLECLDTNASKEAALEKYRDTGYYWIEDKFSNAVAGQAVGMKPILIEHGWNMDEVVPTGMKKVTTWKELYNYIVEQGESNV
jgi:FMN phosphatase YigB (HAD superfamily)